MMHKGPPWAMDCTLVLTRLFQVTESGMWLWCRWSLMLIRRLILFSIKHPFLNQAISDKLVDIIWLGPLWGGLTASAGDSNIRQLVCHTLQLQHRKNVIHSMRYFLRLFCTNATCLARLVTLFQRAYHIFLQYRRIFTSWLTTLLLEKFGKPTSRCLLQSVIVSMSLSRYQRASLITQKLSSAQGKSITCSTQWIPFQKCS